MVKNPINLSTSHFVNVPGDKKWLPACLYNYSLNLQVKSLNWPRIWKWLQICNEFSICFWFFSSLHCEISVMRQQHRKNSPYEYQMISWFFSHTYCVPHCCHNPTKGFMKSYFYSGTYRIVASRSMSQLGTKNKSCPNELKFWEDSRNCKSIRCWKFQLCIFKNKKVLFIKKNAAC